MKPLNSKERDSAFWSFALFFILSLALIMSVISLAFVIPHKQFTELKKKVKDYDAFMSKQRGFMSQIDTINFSFQHYNDPGNSQTFLQRDITNKNLALADAIGDENPTNRIYHKIIDNYKVMLTLKADLDAGKQQLQQANTVLRDCQEENRKTEKELNDNKRKN